MFELVVATLPIQIRHEFRQALTHGYWSSGVRLTEMQRRICEQALLLHEVHYHNSAVH
jgi:uncharacterized protein YeaC (DUF1315 family)